MCCIFTTFHWNCPCQPHQWIILSAATLLQLTLLTIFLSVNFFILLLPVCMGFSSQNHFLNITVSLILFSYLLTMSVTIMIVLIYQSISSNLSFWCICLIVHLICLPGCPTGTLKLSSWSLLESSSKTFFHLLIIPVCSISKSWRLSHSSFLWCCCCC